MISKRRLVVILGLASTLMPISIDLVLPGFAEIAADLGTTTGQVQYSLALLSMGLALGQLVWGPLSDRYGRQLAFRLGGLVIICASVGCAMATTIEQLILFRFIQGFGGSCFMVVTRAVVRDRYSGVEAVRLFSLLILVLGLSPIVSPFMGSFLLRIGEWSHLFWVFTALSALCVLMIIVWLPETNPVEKRTSGFMETMAAYPRVLRDRKFQSIVLLYALANSGFFAYISASSTIFMEGYDLSAEMFSVIFALGAVALISSAQINGHIVRTFKPLTILKAGISAYIVASALLLVVALTGAGGLWGFVGAVLSLVFCCGFVFPTATALAMETRREDVGTASALMGVTQFIFGALAAFATGALHDGSGRPFAYVLVSIALILLVAIRPCLRNYQASVA